MQSEDQSGGCIHSRPRRGTQTNRSTRGGGEVIRAGDADTGGRGCGERREGPRGTVGAVGGACVGLVLARHTRSAVATVGAGVARVAG